MEKKERVRACVALSFIHTHVRRAACVCVCGGPEEGAHEGVRERGGVETQHWRARPRERAGARLPRRRAGKASVCARESYGRPGHVLIHTRRHQHTNCASGWMDAGTKVGRRACRRPRARRFFSWPQNTRGESARLFSTCTSRRLPSPARSLHHSPSARSKNTVLARAPVFIRRIRRTAVEGS